MRLEPTAGAVVGAVALAVVSAFTAKAFFGQGASRGRRQSRSGAALRRAANSVRFAHRSSSVSSGLLSNVLNEFNLICKEVTIEQMYSAMHKAICRLVQAESATVFVVDDVSRLNRRAGYVCLLSRTDLYPYMHVRRSPGSHSSTQAPLCCAAGCECAARCENGHL